jgi:hypothetical protein
MAALAGVAEAALAGQATRIALLDARLRGMALTKAADAASVEFATQCAAAERALWADALTAQVCVGCISQLAKCVIQACAGAPIERSPPN